LSSNPSSVPSRRVLPHERPSIGRFVLTTIVLGWFALLILVPTFQLAKQAFAGGVPRFVSLLTSREAVRAFGMTLWITFVVTLINTLFGVAFALVVARQRFWGRALADGLVDLSFAVSPVVAGFMLALLYGPNGWFGRVLEAVGIQVVFAPLGMVLASLFVTMPFVVREVVPVLREIGVDQEEAAKTLGAGQWRTFFRITLPSIRWGLAYGATLTAARSLGEYGALLVVSGNLLGRTQTATLYIHDCIDSFDKSDGAYAASLALAAVSIVLLVAMEVLRKHTAQREGKPDAL
jgi:sulfate/thiosulfate transport system permease protein